MREAVLTKRKEEIRYREADKKTFKDAKDATLLYLNTCPTEVIHQFIN